MPDTEIQDVGLFNSSAPALAVEQYGTVAELTEVAAGLIGRDGARVSLSGNPTAEAWYELEERVDAATKRLGDVNQAFQREIKSLQDSLKGEAGEAFGKYSTRVLKKSEDLYQSLVSRQYGTTIGNIGHAIQAFGAAWWDAVDRAEEVRVETLGALHAVATAAIAAAEPEEIPAIVAKVKASMEEVQKASEENLVKHLQELLAGLGDQYANRGQDLSPLHIVGGRDVGGDGGKGLGGDKSGGEEKGKGKGKGKNDQDGGKGGGKGGGEGGGEGGGKDDLDLPGLKELGLDDLGKGGEGGDEGGGKGEGGGLGGLGGGLGGSGSDGGAGSGPGSGKGGNKAGVLDKAKKAAEQAIDKISGGTTDPAAQKALGDAKKAVSDAIDGVKDDNLQHKVAPVPTGSDGPGTGGSGLPGTTGKGAGGDGLDAAKKAATDAIKGIADGTTDPEAQKALGDAKKAVGDAIDGIGAGLPGLGGVPGPGAPGPNAPGNRTSPGVGTSLGAGGIPGKAPTDKSPGSTPRTVGGDPAADAERQQRQKVLDDARKAAMDAIDGVADDTTAPAADKALDQAKKDAAKAIDALKGDMDGFTGKDDPLSKDPLSKGDPLNKTLDQAKTKALDAIDGVADRTTDPEARKALDEAKKAVGKAIDGLKSEGLGSDGLKSDLLAPTRTTPPTLSGGPEGEALREAQDHARKAIDDALTHTTDPEARKALEDAKAKVDDALGLDRVDPETRKVLDDAKHAADRTFDDLIRKSTDPEAKQALETAKDAVEKAIDGVRSPGDESGMRDFLTGRTGGLPPGLDLDSKVPAGGDSGGDRSVPTLPGAVPTSSPGPDAPGRARFDTDVAQQRGLVSAASPAPVGLVPGTGGAPPTSHLATTPAAMQMGGMPMGGMPMGGMPMGGMGGAGQQNPEREPQIWMQADKDAWTEDPEASGDPVLGRS
ncbi:hypothetical protein AB0I60_23090 [Actinosynnema sp. NPDC050436]|uniref:hypothetical protein n=1 Tax=Actinosynnema sp. NPDC050436 TaxID=3155659 RepID=UPI0033D93BC5